MKEWSTFVTRSGLSWEGYIVNTDSLHVLADENIPLVQEAFGTLGSVRTKPGRAIQRGDVQDADVLLVRSVTPVGPELLESSDVQFVGSATIGTDHVDQAYLASRGIAFAHAPGSNADSVADYVIAALTRLAVRTHEPLREKTAGIVGCGNIGGRLVQRLSALGMRVLKNDPPRAERAEQQGAAHDFVSLDAVLAEADVVTLHVPLTREGSHATYRLVDATTLHQMNPEAWLINTSRGAVVDGQALKARLHQHLGAVVLDVWEDEPTPDIDLVRQVDLATPHIAGYAYDGKVRGTAMLYQALVDHLGQPATWEAGAALAAEGPLVVPPPDPALPETEWLDHAVRAMYEIVEDDGRLRELPEHPADEQGAYFSSLRKHYPRRREFSQYALPDTAVPAAYQTAVTSGLTVRIKRSVEFLARGKQS